MNSLAQIMIFIHNEESINLWLQSERQGGWCGKTKGKQLLSLNNYRLIIPKKKKSDTLESLPSNHQKKNLDHWAPPNQVRTLFHWSMTSSSQFFSVLQSLKADVEQWEILYAKWMLQKAKQINHRWFCLFNRPQESCHNFELFLQGHPPSKACSNTSSIRLASSTC